MNADGLVSFVSALPVPAAAAILSIALLALSWLLTYLIHSTVLLGGVYLATRRLPANAAAFGDPLWKGALLGGVLTATVQMAVGVEPIVGTLALPQTRSVGVAPGSMAAPSSTGTASSMGMPPTAVRAPAPRSAPSSEAPALTSRPSNERAGIGPLAIRKPPRSTGTPLARERAITLWPALLVGAWLAVALASMGWLGVRRTRLAFMLRARRDVVDPPLPELLERLRSHAGLTGAVRLTLSNRISGPISFGRDEICVPERVLTRLDERQQAGMLAHELGHLARRDPSWLLVCAVIERVFFFQPLNALARRRIQEGAEYLCDDYAVALTGERLSLATCLAEVASWVANRPSSELATPMASGRSPLVRRIENLRSVRRSNRFRVVRAGGLAGAALLLFTVVLAAPGVSSRRGTELALEPSRASVPPVSPAPRALSRPGLPGVSRTSLASSPPVSLPGTPSPVRLRSDIVVHDEVEFIETGGDLVVKLNGERVPRSRISRRGGIVRVVAGDGTIIQHDLDVGHPCTIEGDGHQDGCGECEHRGVPHRFTDSRARGAPVVLAMGWNAGARAVSRLDPVRVIPVAGYDDIVIEEERDWGDEERDYRSERRRARGPGAYRNELIAAVSGGDYEWTEELLDDGADPNETGREGFTALHVAVAEREFDIMVLLIDRGADVDVAERRGRTPLHLAAGEDDLDALALLLDRGAAVSAADERGVTPLHVAASEDGWDVVEALLERGADVAAADRRGRTPLHCAALAGAYDAVVSLLEHGAAIDTPDDRGRTALDCAEHEGEDDIVDLLLERRPSER